jgi:hypothetical protein
MLLRNIGQGDAFYWRIQRYGFQPEVLKQNNRSVCRRKQYEANQGKVVEIMNDRQPKYLSLKSIIFNDASNHLAHFPRNALPGNLKNSDENQQFEPGAAVFRSQVTKAGVRWRH